MLVVASGLRPLAAQELKYSFPDRRAIVINNCPFVELSGFTFGGGYASGGTRFSEDLRWKNVSSQPLIAAEVVILKYDAFDRRLVGTRWTITGHNSADWSPLPPGASDGDGTTSYGNEEVFTAIAYVRAARLKDGTIWQVNEAELLARLKKDASFVKDFGDVRPDPKAKVPEKP